LHNHRRYRLRGLSARLAVFGTTHAFPDNRTLTPPTELPRSLIRTHAPPPCGTTPAAISAAGAARPQADLTPSRRSHTTSRAFAKAWPAPRSATPNQFR